MMGKKFLFLSICTFAACICLSGCESRDEKIIRKGEEAHERIERAYSSFQSEKKALMDLANSLD